MVWFGWFGFGFKRFWLYLVSLVICSLIRESHVTSLGVEMAQLEVVIRAAKTACWT